MTVIETDDLKKKTDWQLVKKRVLIVVIIIVLFGLLALFLKDRWREVKFAIEHPIFVRELREVYTEEHRQADQNVLMRQRMELKPTMAVEDWGNRGK